MSKQMVLKSQFLQTIILSLQSAITLVVWVEVITLPTAVRKVVNGMNLTIVRCHVCPKTDWWIRLPTFCSIAVMTEQSLWMQGLNCI